MKNRIRTLRTERGWTQADLATHLDVSRNSVNAIENGKYDPSLPLAFKISELFGLPADREDLPARLIAQCIRINPSTLRQPGGDRDSPEAIRTEWITASTSRRQ